MVAKKVKVKFNGGNLDVLNDLVNKSIPLQAELDRVQEEFYQKALVNIETSGSSRAEELAKELRKTTYEPNEAYGIRVRTVFLPSASFENRYHPLKRALGPGFIDIPDVPTPTTPKKPRKQSLKMKAKKARTKLRNRFRKVSSRVSRETKRKVRESLREAEKLQRKSVRKATRLAKNTKKTAAKKVRSLKRSSRRTLRRMKR